MGSQLTTLRYDRTTQALVYGTKVAMGGGLVGTAFLFPVANLGPPWLGTSTLVIFATCASGFGAMNHKAFVGFPIPAVVMLVLVCAAVLTGGTSTRNGLAPYLPIALAAVIGITVVGHKVWPSLGHPQRTILPQDERPLSSDTRWSACSYQTFSPQPNREPPTPGGSADHLALDRYGPGPLSRFSSPSGTEISRISLPGPATCCREHWDPETRGFFPYPSMFGEDASGMPQAGGRASPDGGATLHEEPRGDAVSDRASARSTDLLLEAQGAGPRS